MDNLGLIVGQIDARLTNMRSEMDRREGEIARAITSLDKRLAAIERRLNRWAGGLTALGMLIGSVATYVLSWITQNWK